MQNNRHFPQTENSLNNWDAPVRHAPGRYRDYREKYALTTGEVTARYIIEVFFTMFEGSMEREQIYNIIRQCNMHRQKVLGVCMRYFGFSIDDAEDCVQ